MQGGRSNDRPLPIRGAEMVASQQNATVRPNRLPSLADRAKTVVAIQVPSDMAARKSLHNAAIWQRPCCGIHPWVVFPQRPQTGEFAHTIPTNRRPTSIGLTSKRAPSSRIEPIRSPRISCCTDSRPDGLLHNHANSRHLFPNRSSFPVWLFRQQKTKKLHPLPLQHLGIDPSPCRIKLVGRLLAHMPCSVTALLHGSN